MKPHYLIQVIYVPEEEQPTYGIQKVIGEELLRESLVDDTEIIAATAISAYLALEKERPHE
jgi:hypothetical protein